MKIEKLSASSINTYEQCPYKFKLSITGQLPIVTKVYFEFGTLIHEVLDQYFKLHSFNQSFLPIDTLLDIYSKEVLKYRIEDRASEGKKLLNKYYNTYLINNVCRTRETEKKFKICMGKFNLTGKIDRIDELPDLFMEVIDYKTGTPNKTDLKRNKQLLIYALKVFNDYNFELEKCKVSLHYLKKTQPTSVWIYKEEIKEFRIVLEDLYNKIISDIYYNPTKNIFCGNCEAFAICPLFNKRKNVFSSTKKEIVL